MSASGLFVTGTDTGVGKTLIAAGLVRGGVSRGWRVAAMKPVASGAERTAAGLRNADALVLGATANVAAEYEAINPYCFEPPIAPHLAARDAQVSIQCGRIRHEFELLAARADWVVVEAAGGWLAPITDTLTMADLARTLDLPVVMVVGLRLGCLNHALLTKQAIERAGASFAGWIANAIDPTFERSADNLATLDRSLGLGALAVVPYCGPDSAPLELPEAAARLRARTAPRAASR